MPRSHPLLAAALAFVAVALAWLGTAHALTAVDPYRIDSINATLYVLVAVAATGLVVAACLCSLPWALLAAVGVTAGLWWGASESVAVLDGHSGGWMGGFNYLVYLVPLSAAGVCLIALTTCSVVSASVAPRPQPRRPGGVVL
ncbi:hypothetical protein SAMN04489844_1036 [Nocardioides exalbidus]|uniref:Uncharacterized protein n=1 Tax=Nocardioides exalbidus TaxID=402596 RepID=A0A1H4M4C8_9ACTN|nr:hypothetical protein [Nocardioides exalbidus]SEB77657.1 hypothetical protein SAMN04489844_1036 [Nocardioides exalbidus]